MTHFSAFILTVLNILSSLFLVVGFLYLRQVFAKAYQVTKQKSHANWLYLFMVLFLIRPLADLYFLITVDTTVTGSIDIFTRFTTIAAAGILALICLEFKDLIQLKLANLQSIKLTVFFFVLIYLSVGFLFLPVDIFFTELLFLVLYGLFFFSAWVVASYASLFASVFPLSQTLYGIAVILLLAPIIRMILFLTHPLDSFATFSFLEFTRLISLLLTLAISFLLVVSMYVFKKVVIERRLSSSSQ
ncbi:MAG: hypothetical protein Q7S92_04870 [Candidatus Diapherotrites archaeon]|nr:hypothetical protein [Candidatus Diapherotrites archaeon]